MKLKKALIFATVVGACFAAPAAANAASYGNTYSNQYPSAWNNKGADLYGNHFNKGSIHGTYNQGKVYYSPYVPDATIGRYAPNVNPGVSVNSGYGGSVRAFTVNTVHGVTWKVCVDLDQIPDACGGWDALWTH